MLEAILANNETWLLIFDVKILTLLDGTKFLLKMEYTQKSIDASQAQDSLSVQPVNGENPTSRSDILNRRMKNRERQRRYRARKRLEADLKKSSMIGQSSSPVVELQSNGVVSNGTARVHCRRDWKKDARKAHILKDPEVSPSGCGISVVVSGNMGQTSGFSSASKGDPLLEMESNADISPESVNNATHRATNGRRDWKAEARKKKS